jgi:hypothetical protein
MIAMPEPSDLVLVATMPSPRDMEIARLLGWYRIPLRTAPKVIAVDYLAFYQPAAFGAGKWQVEYVAPVHGHELALRADLLKDEADHLRAEEEYIKIQIGGLVRLPRPIPAKKWKRLNFVYTTGQHFLAAESINDLPVKEQEERLVLWRALRERAVASELYAAEDLPEFPLDSELLALLGLIGGGFDLAVGGEE